MVFIHFPMVSPHDIYDQLNRAPLEGHLQGPTVPWAVKLSKPLEHQMAELTMFVTAAWGLKNIYNYMQYVYIYILYVLYVLYVYIYILYVYIYITVIYIYIHTYVCMYACINM